jgi:hypothetical protein
MKLKHDKHIYTSFVLSGFFSFSRFFSDKMRFFFALTDSFAGYLLTVVHPNFRIKFPIRAVASAKGSLMSAAETEKSG